MGKEVQRWDPPNREMPKLPIPLWGACSKYIRVEEGCAVIKSVKRTNDFALNAPKSTVPPVPTNFSYPFLTIEKSAHNYTGDTIQDVKLPPMFFGPKLIENGKNGYVPSKPLSYPYPQIDAPVFTGVESSNHFSPDSPIKIAGEVMMSTPLYPIQDHGSKYSTQSFGCSGKGLTVMRQKVLNGPGNRDPGDRNSCIIEAKNKYELQELENGFPKSVKTGGILSTSLLGPKYL